MTTTDRPMPESVMRPIHIIAKMAEPIVYYGDGLTFDGILAAALMRDLPYAVTSKWPTATRDEPWLRDLTLPLARWSVPFAGACDPNLRDPDGKLWGWHASSVFADWRIHGRTEVRKRVPSDEHKRWGDGYEVNVSAGRFKAHDLKLPSRFATELHWFANGRPAPILRLLTKHITSLGRKTGMGNGRVLTWHVEDWHEDWSIRCGSLLSRPMPRGYELGAGLSDAHISRRGIRAPYWHPSRLIECIVPGELDVAPWA